jgi:hypothetical protein
MVCLDSGDDLDFSIADCDHQETFDLNDIHTSKNLQD